MTTRRAFAALFALLPFAQPVVSPNPGDCFAPFVRVKGTRDREDLHRDMQIWAKRAALSGVQTGYVLLAPTFASLRPSKGGVVYAGVRLLVSVSPEPLRNPLTGEEADWLLSAECGRHV